MVGVGSSFGPEWTQKVHAIIVKKKPELLQQWAIIDQTYNAYMRWNTANDLVSNIITDRSRAQLQADMPEYETYLPMFGDAGVKLLEKLRENVSSLKYGSTPDKN